MRKLTLSRHFNIRDNSDSDIVPHTDPTHKASGNDEIIIHTSLSPPPIHTDLKPKSRFYPTQSKGNLLESFSTVVSNEFRSINNDIINKHNITNKERAAIKSLSENDKIVIKSADKGGGVVILDKTAYLTEANRLLSDNKYYKLLTNDPSTKFSDEYHRLINDAYSTNILSKNEYKFLTIENPVMSIFYFLPKIHKNLTNPPGRPIISGIGSLTSNLSQYVDRHLQKHVGNLKSHLKDTTSLLKDLQDFKWVEGYKFATLDVSSLYTNIPHAKGINSTKRFLDQDSTMPMKQRLFILDSIHFILTHNVFDFNKKLYIQQTGTAMGTRFAPSFANLYMGDFENDYVYGEHQWNNQIVYFKRYIDDLIFVWNGTETEWTLFTHHLNNNAWGLQFSGEINVNNINYLDISISHKEGKIVTKNYFKDVDCNSFLHFSSNHHKQWLKNVPYGQFRRIRRNCTNDADFERQSEILKTRFKEKHYPAKLINDAYEKTDRLTQKICLNGNKNTEKDKNKLQYKISFITTYNQNYRHIKNILEKNWHLLLSDPYLKEIIPKRPPMIFKRAKTLKNKIAPSNFSRQKSTNNQTRKSITGSYRCQHSKCLCCQTISHGKKSFVSTATGESFEIKQNMNCGSTYVIYLLECSCKLQYIGRTSQALRARLNNHRHNISRGFQQHSVSRHAAKVHNCKMGDFQITPIEQINKDTQNKIHTLNQREMFWIFKLNSMAPIGLNESLENVF